MDGDPGLTDNPENTRGDDGEDYQYRRMLVEVGHHLGKRHVEDLVILAGLSTSEQEEVLQIHAGWFHQLSKKLEQKSKIQPGDVSWLAENLKPLQHEAALQVVMRYISKSSEDIPSEPESDHSDESECQVNTFEEFLEDIHLKNKFPQKLTLKSFLMIKDKIDSQMWVDSFWQKLTSLDYRAGYPQHYMSRAFSMRDFIFGILHCADDFLRQDILEKMSACQLAVPMVVQGVSGKPLEFLLWALRRITKKWKGRDDSCALEQPIVNHPVFMVSVIRIGDVRISKSQLLNTMLGYSQGNTPHGYFLTMEKDFVKPLFSVGSIECAWFLPLCDNENEIFPEITTFFNLRGDCRIFPTQTEFACKAADLTIALIATGKRKEYKHHISSIRKHSRKTLFVSIREEDKPSPRPQKVHRPEMVNDWLFVKVLQIDVLSREICQQIAMPGNSPKRCNSLVTLTKFCGKGMLIDENKPSCQKAKRLVQELFKPVESKTILELKKECFPLQKLLQDRVQIDKERFEITNEQTESFEHQRQKMRARKKRKREKQLQIGFSGTIKSYHATINAHKGNSGSLQYLFAFLQEKINKIVNENTQKDMNQLSELEKQIQLHVKHTKVSNDGTKVDKTTESSYQGLVSAYNSLHKSCQLKNLGCEHFLRELGQLFEAFEEVKCLAAEDDSISTADIALLPSLAARLVTELHSFELMDGDTGSVPLVWITNVLDNLTRDLGDPRILVISVIGVQSSGKSTLLNSMFGLRFPVRAGRCTRGLFFRLLKLDNNLARELGFSYLVVVDTEGIRSIDHDDRRFDNELVTLALSIANITIFNIEGENIGPDMTGILQIAAHALMRMKEVDLACHCRIVQQRVSDLTAAERNKANTNRIMETLDEATKLAAEEEGLQGRYKKFSDVVDLQVDDSLQYIPCLWTGGMSPPNHMYSDTVTKLKSKLIQDIREGKVLPDLTLSYFTERVRDVWRAIREENFVFNFQDSVRAVAFNKFCLEYNKWIIEMRQRMMIVTTEAYCRLTSYIHVSRLSPQQRRLRSGLFDLHMFPAHDSEPDIEKLKECIRTTAAKEKEKLLAHMESYIAGHPQKQYMFAYKQGFTEDAKLVIREIKNQALATINDEYELQQVKSDLPAFQNKWRHRLTLEAKKEAVKLQKASIKSTTLSSFDGLWYKWMGIINDDMNLTKTMCPISSLQTLCEKLLLRVTSDLAVGSEVRSLMDKEGGIDKHSESFDCSKYIHDKILKAWLMQTGEHSLGISEQQIGRQCVNHMSHFVQTIIQDNLQKMLQSDTGRAFDENGYQLMLRATLHDLTANKYQFKPPSALIAKSLLRLSCLAFQYVVQCQSKHTYQCAFWLQKEKDMHFEDMQAFLSNDQRYIDERCASFLCYFMQPIYVWTFRDRYAEFLSENLYKPVHDQFDSCPWDFLRHLANTNTTQLVGDLREHWIEFQHHLLDPMGQAYKKQNETRQNLIRETLGHLEQTGQSSPSDISLQSWLDSLAVDMTSPFLQNVGEIFNSPSWSAIKPYLISAMTGCLETAASELERVMRITPGLSLFCCEMCPMCGVPCNKIAGHHDKHFAFLHRPIGCAEYHIGGRERYADCTVLVQLRGYTLPYWRISRDYDNPGMNFWRWLMAKHVDILARRFDCVGFYIPPEWYHISEEEALCYLEMDEQMKRNGRFAAGSATIPSISLTG